MHSAHSLQHLLTMESLDRTTIQAILARAEYFQQQVLSQPTILSSFRGKIITHLFFEPSTRTRNSFIVAAHKLGAIVLDPNLSHSALLKGESLLDSVRTFIAMGSGIVVIRHSQARLPAWIAEQLQDKVAIVNAGDGCNQHPTQALIDLLTIQQYKQWDGLKVAIIGDIVHSRVARSLIHGLTSMQVANIHLIGPTPLLPQQNLAENVNTFNSLEDGIKDADVIVTLRIQKERHSKLIDKKHAQFHQHFGLTSKRLKLLKRDAIIMHPGPVNRDVEISSAVADGRQSVILQQVHNGVAIRMAVFDLLSSQQ